MKVNPPRSFEGRVYVSNAIIDARVKELAARVAGDHVERHRVKVMNAADLPLGQRRQFGFSDSWTPRESSRKPGRRRRP